MADVYDFRDELEDFVANFEARGWEGLDYRDPTNSGHGDWEVFVVKKDEPNSWNPEETVDVYARFRITREQAKTCKAGDIAKGLAIQVAGRSAHEALEWCRFQGEPRINPHNKEQIEEAAEAIRCGLVNGQSECRP